ncbi:DNA repair protein rad8 [Naviculisporaceae sp. PSN 640]
MAPVNHLSDPLAKYISVGCLILSQENIQLPGQSKCISLPQLPEWHHFSGLDGPRVTLLVPPTVQKTLLASTRLSPLARLVSQKWIHLSYKSNLDASEAIIRVYILPDDVDNRAVPRSDDALHKARRQLMNQLDFSSAVWNGKIGSDTLPTSPVANDGPSLLELFNTIPSPDPSAQDIQDPDYAGAIEMVMESDIIGLKTTLHPYQRRSVAVMLQREAETRRVMDPRLVEHLDHAAQKWYYDPVAGTILREPRFYDSPRGGILAEEMGSGKTLMCIVLCLATRHMPARMPEEYWTAEPPTRKTTGTLADMAAACVTKNGVSWKPRLEIWEEKDWEDEGKEEEVRGKGPCYDACIEAVQRNPGCYSIRRLPRRRRTRFGANGSFVFSTVYLSHASLIVVPPNLLQQWKQEIQKHTIGVMKVFVCAQDPDTIPPVAELLGYDLILFSSTAFHQLAQRLHNEPDGTVSLHSGLARIHFKRCIVDEGHRLGSSTSSRKLDLQAVLDCLHYTSRWIVTGTPSKGLFGIDERSDLTEGISKLSGQSSAELEKDDLRRIGAIATHYLKVRPWAKVKGETGESPADWALYVMQPKHSPRSVGRPETLKATLQSLIIRHRLSDISKLLPTVNEKIVFLEPCYQDTMVLNIFSMMIIANSVQSQRTDRDYFFHPKQRSSLLQLVSNLSQASFFGGSFFSAAEINNAVETAEKFLEEKKVAISTEDETLLRQAISFGRLAVTNSIKRCANECEELPLYVKNFPFARSSTSLVREWSLDGTAAPDKTDNEPVLMSAGLIAGLQKLVRKHHRQFGYYDFDDEIRVQIAVSQLKHQGNLIRQERSEARSSNASRRNQRRQPTLAGNTQIGEENNNLSLLSARRVIEAEEDASRKEDASDGSNTPSSNSEDLPSVPEPFAETQVISTASAKLSYLIDQIVQYHRDEQILVFYDNDHTAYNLAVVLEVLGIQHFIYAKGLSRLLKTEYVAAFTRSNSKFRVMLMDINQAAFGLNMQTASRIYFINPAFNRQVEAQAVGRAKRIGQLAQSVTVETLVLRGTLEELIIKRRAEMTQQEQRKCHSIIDDKPIYEWILNAKILPMPGGETAASGPEQMAKLRAPQLIFGRGFGRETYHDDRDLEDIADKGHTEEAAGRGPSTSTSSQPVGMTSTLTSRPRSRSASPSSEEPNSKRVRFAVD